MVFYDCVVISVVIHQQTDGQAFSDCLYESIKALHFVMMILLLKCQNFVKIFAVIPRGRPIHVVQWISHSDATCNRVWRAWLPLFGGSIRASVR